MFESRIKLLQDALSTHNLDALLVTSPYNIAYLTGIHAFSIEEREARILVTKKEIILFTDARYVEMVKPLSFITLCEIGSKSPFLKLITEIIKKHHIKHIGFEEENISFKEVSDLEESLMLEGIPTSDIVEELRLIKDNHEAESIRRACQLTDLGFEYIVKYLTPSTSELEVKAHLENFIRLQGGELAFPSIIAFGKNSAIPHHMSTYNKLNSQDIVLLDFGAKVNGYCADMTRTIFLGNPIPKHQEIYKATKDAQEVSLDYLKQHMKEGFLTKNIHEYATSHLKAMELPPIPHAIGHGVGLQVHELPVVSPYSEEPLAPGMVITVEPGVYLPGIGGVRIEDTVLITTDGIEVLTKSPKELIIL